VATTLRSDKQQAPAPRPDKRGLLRLLRPAWRTGKMSGSTNRYTVPPTVTVMTVMKARLIGATKGHALLKKKADALTMRYRQLLKEIVEAKNGMGDAMKGSFFSLAEAKYAGGDSIKHTVFDNVERATLKVYTSQENVAGVKIPKFESVSEPGETKMELTGLGKGGQQIQACRKAYVSAVQLLVQLANLQTAFITLDEALKVTNRRVNALENVVKPKIENTISYIKVRGPLLYCLLCHGSLQCWLVGSSAMLSMCMPCCCCIRQGELDELEREEFFRLKKVQKNKQKVAAREAASKVRAHMACPLLPCTTSTCSVLFAQSCKCVRESILLLHRAASTVPCLAVLCVAPSAAGRAGRSWAGWRTRCRQEERDGHHQSSCGRCRRRSRILMRRAARGMLALARRGGRWRMNQRWHMTTRSGCMLNLTTKGAPSHTRPLIPYRHYDCSMYVTSAACVPYA
jgi:V-type H+-transporting ATPase subunit D